MRRQTALVAVTTLLAGLLALAPASPAGACSASNVRNKMRSGNLEVVGLRTYHLEIKAAKESYRVGDMAKVNVLVTRPAHEDPVGAGVQQEPPQSFPAEGANVGIGLRVGEVFLFGHGTTNADGKVQIKIKIQSYTPAGKATADAYAWRVAADTTCLRVEENGYTHKTNLFNVLRRV